MAKTTATTATATDPATVNVFATAPFSAGPGAREGGIEIDEVGEGALAGEGEAEVEGGGEGGEWTVAGDGADFGADVFDGDGAETGRLTRGDGEGPGVGDCAITEHMKNAVSIINNTTLLEAAILEIDVGELARKITESRDAVFRSKSKIKISNDCWFGFWRTQRGKEFI